MSRQLHVLFHDRPKDPVPVEREALAGLTADEAFDRACQEGEIFQRAVDALWVVDRSTGAEEIRRVFGAPPPGIQARYAAFLGGASDES